MKYPSSRYIKVCPQTLQKDVDNLLKWQIMVINKDTK
jgi:hypothetical protein